MRRGVQPGQIIQDTYRIERQIGVGGMGAVYEATHVRLPRRFAIKFLECGRGLSETSLIRFQREAENTSRLVHPHIVDVLDYNRTLQGEPYIVMELLQGEDLSARLKRQHRLGLEQALAIFRQLGEGLRAAHACRLIHRDLNPRNIFLCRRGEQDDFVKILDFGVSRMLELPSGLTTPATLIGTPHYMSPEQVRPFTDSTQLSEVDERADLYAATLILFEMVSGQRPFQADTMAALSVKILHDPPPSIRDLCPEIPLALARVLAQGLAKRPEERFSCVGDLWSAVDAAVGPSEDARELGARSGGRVISGLTADDVEATGDTVVTVVSSPARRASAPRRPRRWWPLVVGVAVSGVIAGLLVRGLRHDGQSGMVPATTAMAPDTSSPALARQAATADQRGAGMARAGAVDAASAKASAVDAASASASAADVASARASAADAASARVEPGALRQPRTVPRRLPRRRTPDGARSPQPGGGWVIEPEFK